MHWKQDLICEINKFSYLCARVSHIRPAPAKLPQDRKVARVCGCSGAIYQAYPFFVPIPQQDIKKTELSSVFLILQLPAVFPCLQY